MKNTHLFSRVGIFLALLLVTSSLYGQCPSDITPTNVGWHDTTASTTVLCGSVGTCTITVSFCWRALPGIGGSTLYETYMYNIDENCDGCGNYTWQDIFSMSMKLTYQTLGSGVPGCGYVNTMTWQGYRPPCWKRSSTGNGFTACSTGTDSYCEEICSLCYASGIVYSSSCT